MLSLESLFAVGIVQFFQKPLLCFMPVLGKGQNMIKNKGTQKLQQGNKSIKMLQSIIKVL